MLVALYQTVTTAQRKPSDFTEETSPNNNNFEVYSQYNGVNRKAGLYNLKKYFTVNVNTTPIDYTPTATGNTANLMEMVTDSLGDNYFIDADGDSFIMGSSGGGSGSLDSMIVTIGNGGSAIYNLPFSDGDILSIYGDGDVIDVAGTGAGSTRDIEISFTPQAAGDYNVTFDGGGNPSFTVDSGGGASQLTDLSDVNTATPTKGNIMVADGTDWEVVTVGSNSQVLTANSGQPSGVEWTTLPAGGVTATNYNISVGSSTVSIYGEAGVTAAIASGEITITIPLGVEMPRNISVDIANGDMVFTESPLFLSSTVRVTIDNSANDNTNTIVRPATSYKRNSTGNFGGTVFGQRVASGEEINCTSNSGGITGYTYTGAQAAFGNGVVVSF